ncbi:MAG: cupredoxin domain-containing protein [Ilumatobacteraceae bacterium]
MKNRYLLLAAILLPVAGACSSDGNSSAATPAPSAPIVTVAPTASSAAPTPSAAPSAETTVAPTGSASAGAGAVGIADFTFTPATVNIPVGGSFVWTNNDNQAHTATSAGNFDAGAIQPGTSATVEFATAGSFTYICSFHPFMTGTVVVG